MISNDIEYNNTKELIKKWDMSMLAQRKVLRDLGLTKVEIHRALGPSECFYDQLIHEVECYEKEKI